jgi:hypothetical protein
VRDLNDNETTYTKDIDYTVDYDIVERAPGGGTITLLAGNLTSGYELTIRRVRSILQSTDFRTQGTFYPEAHEDSADHQIMVDQQQQDHLNRCVYLPETITASEFDPELPAEISDAGSADKIWTVNSAANGITLGMTIQDIIDLITGGVTPTGAWPLVVGAVQTGDFTAVIDTINRVNPTSGAITVTLPTAVGDAGHMVVIKNTANTPQLITVDGSGSETIDGSLTYPMKGPYGQLALQSDGAGWTVLRYDKRTENAIYEAPTGTAATDSARLAEMVADAFSSGYKIKLAPGTWVVDAEITNTWADHITGIIIEGSMVDKTIIQNEITGGGSIFDFRPSVDYKFCRGAAFTDITFQGPQVETPVDHRCMTFAGMSNFLIKRCKFELFPSEGVRFLNDTGDPSLTWIYKFEDVEFDHCATSYSYALHTGSAANVNQVFENVRIMHCGGGMMAQPQAAMWNNCTFAYTKARQSLLLGKGNVSCKQPILLGCNFEGNSSGDVHFAGGVQLYAANCNHNDNYSSENSEIDQYSYRFGCPGTTTWAWVQTITVVGVTATINANYIDFDTWPQAGDTIQIANSGAGNDGFYTIATIVDADTCTVTSATMSNESGNSSLTAKVMQTGVSITQSGNRATVVVSNGRFEDMMHGQPLTLGNCTNPENEGLRRVLSVTDANTVVIENEGGITETSSFACALDPTPASNAKIIHPILNNGHSSSAKGFHFIWREGSGIGGDGLGIRNEVHEERWLSTTGTTKWVDETRAGNNENNVRHLESGHLWPRNYSTQEINFTNGEMTADIDSSAHYRVTITYHLVDEFAVSAGGKQQVTSELAYFTTDAVGKTISFYGASNSQNNGDFTVTDYIDASNIKTNNPTGVAEPASPAAWGFKAFTVNNPTGGPTYKYPGTPLRLYLINQSGIWPVAITWGSDFQYVPDSLGYIYPNARVITEWEWDRNTTKWQLINEMSSESRANHHYIPLYGFSEKTPATVDGQLSTSWDPYVDVDAAAGGQTSVWPTDGASTWITPSSPCTFTYSGYPTKLFHITGYLTLENVSTAQRIGIGIMYKASGGSFVFPSGNSYAQFFHNGTNECYTYPLSQKLQLSTGDAVTIGLRCTSGTPTCDFSTGYFAIKEVEE